MSSNVAQNRTGYLSNKPSVAATSVLFCSHHGKREVLFCYIIQELLGNQRGIRKRSTNIVTKC